MSKYLFILKNQIATAIEYRSNLISTLLLEAIGLAAIYFLWNTIFTSNNGIQTFSLGQIITYYLLIPLFSFAVETNTSELLSYEIRRGNLSSDLIKPYSVWILNLCKQISLTITILVLVLPFYALVLIFASYYTGVWFSPINILVSALIAILAFFLHFSLDIGLAFLAFWMDYVWAFSHFKTIVFKFTGGSSFPLNLLSLQMRTIVQFLPFQFLYFVPISYLMGTRDISLLPTDILIMILWTLFFATIDIFLWERGVRKYEAFGN